MLLNTKTLKEEKFKLYHQQGGICRMCRLELNPDIYSNHLDHDHELHGDRAGKVRGLLCNLCNGTEGQVKHKFERSGLKGKDVDMVQWFKNMIEYYETPVDENPIHPRFVPDRTKWFGRMTRGEMIVELVKQGIEYQDSLGRVQLTKVYGKGIRKILKEGKCLK